MSPSQQLQLSGRTCLVTGAGNGLGRAIAQAAASAGARLILVGRDVYKLRGVADDYEWPSGVRVAGADVSDPESVGSLRSALADEDVSILVNNAGVAGPVRPLVAIDPPAWEDVFATNVRGVFLMCRAFIPPMVESGHGDVINIASVSGKRPLVNRTPYCASKMAVLGLTTSLAAEVGSLGVTVNSLSPGPVAGPRTERVLQSQAEQAGTSYSEEEKAFVARSILGRMIEEHEVGAAVVAMLAMPGLCAADIDLSAGMAAR